MHPGIMVLNNQRYIVPYWIPVGTEVTMDNILDHVPAELIPMKPKVEVYQVTNKPYVIKVMFGKVSCDCPGFQFRRKCKHVTMFLETGEV